jgi:16S rRNA (adenine1518-N6/adenine1519-N6)-dimethyltransferase
VVLEVGPGLGVLTKEMAPRAGRVIAIELDERLAEALHPWARAQGNVTIVRADILELEPGLLVREHAGAEAYKLVANLPYYISSPVVRHFLEAPLPPQLMVLTLQREVAENMAATPGRMSLLSVSVQFYGVPRIVATIPPSSFFPAPQVESAVVRIDVRERPAVDVDPKLFFRIVRAGFSGRRKQLHNALRGALWMSPANALRLLEGAGMDPRRRAQTLSLEEWAALARAFARQRPEG